MECVIIANSLLNDWAVPMLWHASLASSLGFGPRGFFVLAIFPYICDWWFPLLFLVRNFYY
jgi:hypothetical protein